MKMTRTLIWLLALALLGFVFLALPISTARAADPVIVRVTTTGTTTWPCGDTWGNACALQTALTRSVAPSELWVAEGFYSPGIDRAATFQLRDDIALYGGFAMTETLRSQRDLRNNRTTLDGRFFEQNVYHVVTGSGVTNTAVLDGFWVIGGRADSFDLPDNQGGGMYNDGGSPTISNVTFANNSASRGGGMYNSNNSNPTLTNVIFNVNSASICAGMCNDHSSPMLNGVEFVSNSAEASGGGMYNFNYSNPTLTNATFRLNSAYDGAGVYNDDHSNPAFTNVTFSENAAAYGGGMYNYNNSNPTLTNVTFSANSASIDGGNGGGMYNDHSSPMLTNVSFSNNSAYYDGAAMYNHVNSSPTLASVTVSGNGDGGMHNDTFSSPTLTNVTFSDNIGYGMDNNSNSSPTLTNVTFSGNQGSGISNYGYSSPTLTNVTFFSNTALQYGGGMNNDDYSSPTLTNVTFSGNSATEKGGGMRNDYFSSPTIRNTIFWGNRAPIASQILNEIQSTTNISDSVVQGGYASGTHIITADPRLGPLGNWGGSTQTIPLLHGSSAIDSGNDAVCPPTDQRGVPRPQGPHCDIGAYEGQLLPLNLPLISR